MGEDIHVTSKYINLSDNLYNIYSGLMHKVQIKSFIKWMSRAYTLDKQNCNQSNLRLTSEHWKFKGKGNKLVLDIKCKRLKSVGSYSLESNK